MTLKQFGKNILDKVAKDPLDAVFFVAIAIIVIRWAIF